MAHCFLLALFFVIQSLEVSGLTVEEFIPFGESNGDTVFFSNDDNTTSITIPLKFPFFSSLYSIIHINNNGLLSFESVVPDYTPQDFPVKGPESRGVGAAFIAPFWADVDTRAGPGRVYFRSTDNQTVLDMIKRITDKILLQRQSCLLSNKFYPKWALVATWFDVGYYETKYNKLNTFQVVVTTDGLFSFAIFNYAKIEWVTGDASQGTDGLGGTPAMVGVNVGDGVRSIKYEHSLTDEVVRVVNTTNVGVPGQLVYRIDDEVSISTGTGSSFSFFSDKCDTGELCLSPSFGTPHSGGLLMVNGPFQEHLLSNKDNIRMKFEGKDEVLYTKCSYKEGNRVARCPVPLFGPNSIGIKNVTLLIGGCTTGYTGQYRVWEPTIFIDGSLQMFDEDCLEPFNRAVLRTQDKVCIKWNPVKNFATNEIPGIGDVEVGVFEHFTGPGVSYREAGPGNTSGWGTVDLVDNFLTEEFYTTSDGAAVILPELTPTNHDDISNPPPSLLFIRVTAVVNGIEVFASTPLISYIPSGLLGLLGGNHPCDNIKDSAVFNTPPPCPQNVNQSFVDPNLEVDPGCVEGSKAHFNCYTNPRAVICFRVVQRSPKVYTGQCCYGANGALVISKPGAGLPKRPQPGDTYLDHYQRDLWPFLVCCTDPKTPDQKCIDYLRERPASSSRDYVQPLVGFLFEHSLKRIGRSETFLTLRDNRFTAPLNLTSDSSNSLNRTTYLCYQVFLIPYTVVNLFSSADMVINAQYMLNGGHYYISSISIVIGEDNARCTTITVNSSQCQIKINSERITSPSYTIGQYKLQVASSVNFPSNDTLTVNLFSVQSRIIAKVTCGRNPRGFPATNTLSLSLPISLLHLSFHGLLGQLWNVPATVTHPDCEDFALFSHLPLYKVVLPSNATEDDGSSQGNSNRTIPVILHFKSWDTAGSGPCLYTSYEGPSVIAGTASDYIVGNLSSTKYQYSRFTNKCM